MDCGFLTAWEVGVPNPHVVQGSNVYLILIISIVFIRNKILCCFKYLYPYFTGNETDLQKLTHIVKGKIGTQFKGSATFSMLNVL